MRKLIIGSSIALFLLWFTMAMPHWIAVYADNSLIERSAISRAIAKANIGYGIVVLPVLERELAKIPLVKSIKVKSVTGAGLQIELNPYKVAVNLINGYVLTKSAAIVHGRFMPELPIYDCPLSEVKFVANWHKKHLKLLAKSPAPLRELGYDKVSEQWRILWADGAVLLLGKTAVASNNLQHWLSLRQYLVRHHYSLTDRIIDLRYPDGFAYSKY